MHADSHFVIGQAHVNGGKPCQDYATAGDLPGGLAYAVVSDGCSSGGETDIGARIVGLATAAAIREPWVDGRLIPGAVNLQQRSVMAGAEALLGCAHEDMLATAVYAVAGPNDLFAVVQGDGVVAWQQGDQLWMTRFEWDDNAPYYPAYSPSGEAAFASYHGGDLAAERFSSETWVMTAGEPPVLHSSYRYPLGQSMRQLLWPLEAFTEATKLAVFTDGVTQIENVDWRDAVAGLMNFKSTTGEFAKRRLNRFVRDCHKVGRGPIDDLAYAVIDLTEDAPEEAT